MISRLAKLSTRPSRIRLLTPAAFVILAASCHAVKPQSSAPDIIGGSTPGGGSPSKTSTVALVTEDKGGYNTICSGALIAPNLVATATGCLRPFTDPSQLKILFGSSYTDPARVVIAAAQFLSFMPLWINAQPNFEIAVIRLAENAPATAKPIEIFHDKKRLPMDQRSLQKMPYLITGFGWQETGCSLDRCMPGVKKEAPQALLEPVIDNSRAKSLMVIGNSRDRGFCGGDSGAPIYVQIDNKWYLAGTTVGPHPVYTPDQFENDGTLKSFCASTQAVGTFIGDYADWIDKAADIHLSHDEVANPRVPAKALMNPDSLPASPTFSDWHRYDNYNDPVWFTVDTIIKVALKSAAPKDPRAFMLDPSRILASFATNHQFEFKTVHFDDVQRTFGFGNDDGIGMTDLRPLASLPVTRISLENLAIKDFSPIGGMPGIEFLKVGSNHEPGNWNPMPFDLGFLDKLRDLKVLRLEDTPGLDVSKLDAEHYPKLSRLLLQGIGLSDLSFLTGFKKVEMLAIERNNISNISALAGMTSLKILMISKNQISDIAPVASLSELNILLMSHNNLTSLSSLGTHKNLTTLEVSNNQIVDISSLNKDSLPSLQLIDLVNNKLSNIDSIRNLDISTLKKVLLCGNPLPPQVTCPGRVYCPVDYCN